MIKTPASPLGTQLAQRLQVRAQDEARGPGDQVKPTKARMIAKVTNPASPSLGAIPSWVDHSAGCEAAFNSSSSLTCRAVAGGVQVSASTESPGSTLGKQRPTMGTLCAPPYP